MANKDSGWRPKGAMDAFGGYEVWEYNVGPHELNEGKVDGEIDYSPHLEDGETFPTSVDELTDE